MTCRSAKCLGSALTAVWMLTLFDAVCLASKELNTSAKSGDLSEETNQSGLPPEFLLPFAKPDVPETPCEGDNCDTEKDKSKSALATVHDDDDTPSEELSEVSLATPPPESNGPTEECFTSLYPYLKRLEHLKKEALATEMVQSMVEKNMVKAVLLPLYGLSLNAAHNDAEIKEDPIGNNSSLLHWTAFHNAIEHAEMLILKGADVNSENSRLFSPLHVAAWYGRTAIAEIFLLAGTNANSAARHSWTPLYIAAREGHLDVVKILLIAGSNPNSRSLVGWTPLHVAAWKGYLDICEILVDSGARIDVKAYSGELPVNHICRNFHSSCTNRTQNALKELLTP